MRHMRVPRAGTHHARRARFLGQTQIDHAGVSVSQPSLLFRRKKPKAVCDRRPAVANESDLPRVHSHLFLSFSTVSAEILKTCLTNMERQIQRLENDIEHFPKTDDQQDKFVEKMSISFFFSASCFCLLFAPRARCRRAAPRENNRRVFLCAVWSAPVCVSAW